MGDLSELILTTQHNNENTYYLSFEANLNISTHYLIKFKHKCILNFSKAQLSCSFFSLKCCEYVTQKVVDSNIL